MPFKSAFIRVNSRLKLIDATEFCRSFANKRGRAIRCKCREWILQCGALRAPHFFFATAPQPEPLTSHMPKQTTPHSNPQPHHLLRPHRENPTDCSRATTARGNLCSCSHPQVV